MKKKYEDLQNESNMIKNVKDELEKKIVLLEQKLDKDDELILELQKKQKETKKFSKILIPKNKS